MIIVERAIQLLKSSFIGDLYRYAGDLMLIVGISAIVLGSFILGVFVATGRSSSMSIGAVGVTATLITVGSGLVALWLVGVRQIRAAKSAAADLDNPN